MPESMLGYINPGDTILPPPPPQRPTVPVTTTTCSHLSSEAGPRGQCQPPMCHFHRRSAISSQCSWALVGHIFWQVLGLPIPLTAGPSSCPPYADLIPLPEGPVEQATPHRETPTGRPPSSDTASRWYTWGPRPFFRYLGGGGVLLGIRLVILRGLLLPGSKGPAHLLLHHTLGSLTQPCHAVSRVYIAQHVM